MMSKAKDLMAAGLRRVLIAVCVPFIVVLAAMDDAG